VGGPGCWLDWYAAVITGAQDLARWRMLSLLARARPWEQSRELQLALRPIYFADPLCISDRSRRCLMGGDGEVEGDGLGELNSGGGAGGDLILVDAGWRGADVGVASTAAAG
jgi:hypothetical protein